MGDMCESELTVFDISENQPACSVRIDRKQRSSFSTPQGTQNGLADSAEYNSNSLRTSGSFFELWYRPRTGISATLTPWLFNSLHRKRESQSGAVIVTLFLSSSTEI
jgi:hypothetical protein